MLYTVNAPYCKGSPKTIQFQNMQPNNLNAIDLKRGEIVLKFAPNKIHGTNKMF